MVNPHKKQWEEIKEKYKYMINTTKEPTQEQLRFRIECIDELLIQEKEKDLAHFR